MSTVSAGLPYFICGLFFVHNLLNTCSTIGIWNNVATELRGVKKKQGYSWIQIDKEVHIFVTEDRLHLQVREIYTKLTKLMKEIKREGYVLTQHVLHDVREQQKEKAISCYSENLAIA